MMRPAIAAISCALFAVSALAGGSYYSTEFVEERTALDVADGDLPSRLEYHHGIYPLMVWLQLSGQYTPEHAETFRRYLRGERGDPAMHVGESMALFAETLADDGYSVEEPEPRRLVKRRDIVESTPVETAEWVLNCRADAFTVARETYLDRRAHYGAGTPELDRWVGAQLAVFAQCGADEGGAPAEPDLGWDALGRHDRRYQIGAWHFYRQNYLEAAARFEEIGGTTDSPWHRLARYLVPRSLARHATVMETSGAERVRHLEAALAGFEGLAADEAYLAEFPSVANQIMRIRVALNDIGFVGRFERRLIETPSSVDIMDVRDYQHLAGRWHEVDGRPDEYGRWLRHVRAISHSASYPRYEAAEPVVDALFDAWRESGTPPYVYLALGLAGDDTDREDLRNLLAQTRGHTPQTPGYAAMLGPRLRIATVLGEPVAKGELKSAAADFVARAPSNAAANEMRLWVADAASSWREYLGWTSLVPLNVPWTDRFAHSLPASRFNRIASDTRLFPRAAADVINAVFTPAMVVDTLDAPGLSDFQRSRLAIAGWVKALLADDLESAVEIAPSVGRFAPPLAEAMGRFVAARDKRFEAAWIVLMHPGITPWIPSGVGRIWAWEHRPATDRVAVSFARENWWCRGGHDPRQLASELPYFARGMDLNNEGASGLPTAAELFGPIVVRYARENEDDPRVAQALHRVVFATRYSCQSGPGHVSQAAYETLHAQFPDTEWAAKTPYWYE